MMGKATDSTSGGPESLLRLGQERTEAMLNMHKELLDAYDQTSRAWLARVKSEVDFWSELTSQLTTTRTVPEALEAYQKSVMQRMQLATEDGRRMTEDCQKIMSKIAQSLAIGRSGGSS